MSEAISIFEALTMAAPYGQEALDAVERYMRSLAITQSIDPNRVKEIINQTVGSQVYVINDNS